jgi:hypothetical protein
VDQGFNPLPLACIKMQALINDRSTLKEKQEETSTASFGD